MTDRDLTRQKNRAVGTEAHTVHYRQEAYAKNTRSAYAKDMNRFVAWGGRIPATPAMVADYISAHARTHAVATLERWLATLSKAHQLARVSNPVKDELVRAVLKGIRRTESTGQRRVKPVDKGVLNRVIHSICGSGPAEVRDRALILVGFTGAFRRSELCSLEVRDVEFVDREGALITLRRSKTDDEPVPVPIPYGTGDTCPVTALSAWMAMLGTEGPLFRSVDRWGHMSDVPLDGSSVARVIKRRVQEAGLDPSTFSGHSMRAGFVTAADAAGVDALAIARHTRHRSIQTLKKYIRHSNPFARSAAKEVLR